MYSRRQSASLGSGKACGSQTTCEGETAEMELGKGMKHGHTAQLVPSMLCLQTNLQLCICCEGSQP